MSEESIKESNERLLAESIKESGDRMVDLVATCLGALKARLGESSLVFHDEALRAFIVSAALQVDKNIVPRIVSIAYVDALMSKVAKQAADDNAAASAAHASGMTSPPCQVNHVLTRLIEIELDRQRS